MDSKGILWLLVAAVLCGGMGAAHANGDQQDELKVGVVILTAVNLNKDQADEMSARLGTVLEAKHLVAARAGALLRASLDSPVPETCVKRRRCVIELGRQLKVERILFLTLVKVGNQVRLSATPADATTGYANARLRLRVGDAADQERVFADAVPRLLPEAKPRPEKNIEPPNGGDGDGDGGGDGDGDGDTNGNGVSGPNGHGIDTVGKPRRLTKPVLIVGGIGVAALISGAGFGAWATGLYFGQIKPNCPGDCQELLDRTRLRINIADISFAVAAVAGVTAGLLYLYSGESAPKTVSPVVTPTSVGVSWQGRF